ncbi:TetR/AcrR family transcriptional regulator [Nocardioides acrostichi]|uniref:TetR/AcrR family transcriptional regulator n=1 Tax=Nocardioides acrostichi TaxID=2784339 RepID=A0A930UXI2_9ACTN|nr:TetR/AcrR family transcriptional regulator [Nocardioides acrostichi]MBF4160199.1 TetR/AcrR family transcriptional regulator [Nocardioides acrostichi]
MAGVTTRTRLSPDQRRTQLLDLGVRLLSTRSVDELSIDLLAEEAGISRGLLYHYFGNKAAFHEAVVRHAADDLIAQTAPPTSGDAFERLHASMAAYLAYVEQNLAGYLSLVRGSAGGSEAMREIYDEARAALTDRVFDDEHDGFRVPDTPLARLVVRGWAAMAEDAVLSWVLDPTGVSREQLLDMLTAALPSLVATVPEQ